MGIHCASCASHLWGLGGVRGRYLGGPRSRVRGSDRNPDRLRSWTERDL